MYSNDNQIKQGAKIKIDELRRKESVQHSLLQQEERRLGVLQLEKQKLQQRITVDKIAPTSTHLGSQGMNASVNYLKLEQEKNNQKINALTVQVSELKNRMTHHKSELNDDYEKQRRRKEEIELRIANKKSEIRNMERDISLYKQKENRERQLVSTLELKLQTGIKDNSAEKEAELIKLKAALKELEEKIRTTQIELTRLKNKEDANKSIIGSDYKEQKIKLDRLEEQMSGKMTELKRAEQEVLVLKQEHDRDTRSLNIAESKLKYDKADDSAEKEAEINKLMMEGRRLHGLLEMEMVREKARELDIKKAEAELRKVDSEAISVTGIVNRIKEELNSLKLEQQRIEQILRH